MALPLDSTIIKLNSKIKGSEPGVPHGIQTYFAQIKNPRGEWPPLVVTFSVLDDLLDNLLTPCAGTLKTIAFTIYNWQLTKPAGIWYILLVLGREIRHCSLKTVTCEPRLFKRGS